MESKSEKSALNTITDGAESLAKGTGVLSAIRFVQHMIGQSPHSLLAVLLHAYAEIVYPPIDMTFGRLANVFGLELYTATKDLIVFYFIFVGIFYRALSGSSLSVPHCANERVKIFALALIWPIGIFALIPMWVFARVFPEDAEAFDFLTHGLMREALFVVAIILFACVGTAAGIL
ncbi:hypothetical protein [Sphingomonas bacterium]|uniref:hypothetical protein n=1 Tax=Sphingomonas bacterium TaxID=1895847 RepID=UPI002633434D|nr:hypothetical protein [Sphingomonas bacterium]MDB5678515.1 hypothetical protein [Sphingomonas bacterium]